MKFAAVVQTEGRLGNGGFPIPHTPYERCGFDPRRPRHQRVNKRIDGRAYGLKPKDLVGVPWMLAFALRAQGWYLRQDIIWAKPNPMPESVTDRCTKAHEYIFLLSKSERYYFDQDAILEPVSPNTHARVSQDVAAQIGSERAHAGGKTNGNMKAVVRSPKITAEGSGIKNNQSFIDAVALQVTERNKRSVWTVTTQGFKEAHFATFPTRRNSRVVRDADTRRSNERTHR
jgi:hypothetical protein